MIGECDAVAARREPESVDRARAVMEYMTDWIFKTGDASYPVRHGDLLSPRVPVGVLNAVQQFARRATGEGQARERATRKLVRPSHVQPHCHFARGRNR